MQFEYKPAIHGSLLSEIQYDRLNRDMKTKYFLEDVENVRLIREGYTNLSQFKYGSKNINPENASDVDYINARFRAMKTALGVKSNKHHSSLFSKSENSPFPRYVLFMNEEEQSDYFLKNVNDNNIEDFNKFLRNNKREVEKDINTRENYKRLVNEVDYRMDRPLSYSDTQTLSERLGLNLSTDTINEKPTTSTDVTVGEKITEIIKDEVKNNEELNKVKEAGITAVSTGIGGVVGSVATGALEGVLGTGSPIGALAGAVIGGIAGEKVKTGIEGMLGGDAGPVGDSPTVPVSLADEDNVGAIPTDLAVVGDQADTSMDISTEVPTEAMDETQTETITEELPEERVGRNLYKPVHPEAIYLFFGTNLEWDNNLLAYRARSDEWKDISKKKAFMLEQSRFIVQKHGDKILVPKLKYGEKDSAENILKENFEILELYMSYTNNRRYPRTYSNSNDKVVSMRLEDIIEYRKELSGEGFSGSSSMEPAKTSVTETIEDKGIVKLNGLNRSNGMTSLTTQQNKKKFLDMKIANSISDEVMKYTKPGVVPVRNQKHILSFTNIHSKSNLSEMNKDIVRGQLSGNVMKNRTGNIELTGDYTATIPNLKVPIKVGNKMNVGCEIKGVKI